MLEPQTRELLLDLLRPPEGWHLGHAVGTTFTLDLQTLLTAPLAFAMFDWAVDEEGRADPIAILEALRRYAERTTLFCQAGMIRLPAEYQPLLIHLEDCVVPVTAPSEGGIFHPKVWLLQFVRPEQEPRYRLVSLSRNLTFDTSWDTVVSLEGTRRRKRPHSEAVARFVRGVAELGQDRLSADRRDTLAAIADDIVNVKFDHPEGIDDLRLHPLGLGHEAAWPLPEDADRALVISPFLGPGALERISSSGEGHVLVSRPESIDEMGAAALPFGRVTVLSSDVLSDDTLEQGEMPVSDDADEADTDTRLRGLHAKAYAFERGDQLRLFTGSANATDAGFGRNVEFLVELRTRTSRMSIDGFLEGAPGVTPFGALLEDYTPADEPTATEPSRELSSILERAQRSIGALDFRAEVTASTEEDEFLLELHADARPELPPQIREVHCWRITAGQGHQVTPRLDADGLHAALGRVAYEGLTSFFAFEVVADHNGRTDRSRFVVNAKLIGAPTDRAETVIARLLKNRNDLLRYLLFLLVDTGGSMADLIEDMAAASQGLAGEGRPLLGQPALLETLLRALVRDPGRINHVGRLLNDLEAAGRRDDLAPEGLMELWAAIEEVHHELVGGRA